MPYPPVCRTVPRLVNCGGFGIDYRFGNARQKSVGFFLFFERFFQKRGDLGFARLRRVGAGRSVARDFVVLDFLPAFDQRGIEKWAGCGFLDVLIAFGDQPLCRYTRLALGGFAQKFKHFFKARNLRVSLG